MKNLKNLLLILSLVPFVTSCLKTNLHSAVYSSQDSSHIDTSNTTNSSNKDSDTNSSNSVTSNSSNSSINSNTNTSINSSTNSSVNSDTNTSINSSTNSSVNSDTTSETKPTTEIKSQWISLDFTTYGNTFRAELQKLINKTGSKTISYKANNDVLAQSDKATSGSGIVPFYHAGTESYSGDWNKEHVWPNSRGAGKTGPGSDPHMLRPTISSENSSRSNYFYGNSSNDGGNTWDPGSLGYEAARGEAARIIFYCATRYYNTCGSGGSSNGSKPLELSNNPSDDKDLHTMGRLDRLIEWNNKYPVTDQEKKRNEYLYANNFGRNPFIDHPEFANYIWDTNGIRTSQYNGSINTDNTGSTDTKDDTEKEETTYTYDVITDLNYLSTYNTVSIVATDSNNSAAMTDETKSSSLPWYILSQSVTLENLKVTSTTKLVEFEVSKNSAGKYNFKTGEKYLYHYIDGTHYSIGYTDSLTPTTGSTNFDLTINDSNEITFKGELGVYLNYTYKYGTFSGNSTSSAVIRLVY